MVLLKMIKKIKELIKSEEGIQQGTNTVLMIVIGAGILLAVGALFRDRLVDLLDGTFDRFEQDSDDLWG